MAQSLPIDQFLSAPGPILDVRSPGEYAQGHIPGAVSFPLFSDAERASVGICYKQSGRDAAVELGFELVGPRIVQFIRSAKDLTVGPALRVHCWRGGMRSEAMAWFLEMAGFSVVTLIGGYKAFRRWVRETLAVPKSVVVLGGMTGTGKTDILHQLANYGEQILDLEGLANHRGSSYGALMLPPQPSTEQFENLLADRWRCFNLDRPVWVEAESKRIGTCRLPNELLSQMEAAPTLEIIRPLSVRLDLLVQLYGQADPAELITATERIRKRLGGQRTQEAVDLIRAGNLKAAFSILLTYYDRTYRYDLERRRKTIPQINLAALPADESARQLITSIKQWGWYTNRQSKAGLTG